jgi:hypothetical protein
MLFLLKFWLEVPCRSLALNSLRTENSSLRSKILPLSKPRLVQSRHSTSAQSTPNLLGLLWLKVLPISSSNFTSALPKSYQRSRLKVKILLSVRQCSIASMVLRAGYHNVVHRVPYAGLESSLVSLKSWLASTSSTGTALRVTKCSQSSWITQWTA